MEPSATNNPLQIDEHLLKKAGYQKEKMLYIHQNIQQPSVIKEMQFKTKRPLNTLPRWPQSKDQKGTSASKDVEKLEASYMLLVGI